MADARKVCAILLSLLGTLVGTPVLVRAKEITLTKKELVLIVGSLLCKQTLNASASVFCFPF